MHDWFVSNQGECQRWATVPETAIEAVGPVYRLYRFLTDLDDILAQTRDDQRRLQRICPLVRRLLNCATWLLATGLEPDPNTGWQCLMLYDEPSFPLTVQLVTWAPGMVSEIHNHGTWGLVALLSGQEENSFWRSMALPGEFARQADEPVTWPIQPVGSCLLSPGDIVCMMPDTIHQIQSLGDGPSLSLNLYGEMITGQRFEFDPLRGIAQKF